MALQAPQRNVPLSMQAADQLRGLIESGTWPLGSRIPPEHDLSAQLAISRNTLREALRSLVLAGLLEARPGDGTYVRSDSELATTIARQVQRHPVQDAYEVRSMIEERGARLAAAGAGDDELTALGALLDRRDVVRRDGTAQDFVAADLAFHQAVVDAGGNALLAQLYRSITDAVRQTIMTSADVPGSGRVEAGTDLDRRHHELLGAIRRHDVDAAGYAAVDLVHESLTSSAARPGHAENA